MNGKACIGLNMSVVVIARLSDTPPHTPPKSFCCFCCLKMCRQRKVNTDIVPRNKRASPYISKRGLSGGVFSSGGSLGISLTLLHVCECAHVRPCVLVCGKTASVAGGRWDGGRWGWLRGYFATEGTVCRTHILTTLSVVFLNVGVQIFFQPSTVSTELTFLTRLIVS